MPMYEPRILQKGPFRIGEIAVEVCAEPWRATAQYDALVEPAWRARVAEVAAHGRHMWDGVFYRLTDLSAFENGGKGVYRLGTVAYRYVATYRALHAEHAAIGLAPFNHLTTAALIRTCDGHYLFGRRGNGAIDLIGGGVQPEELAVSSGADLERNLRKEIREEVGIPSDALAGLEGLGVVMSGTSNILIIADVATSLTKHAAEEAFARREEDEMAQPVFVPERELAAFLHGLTDYRRLIPQLL